MRTNTSSDTQTDHLGRDSPVRSRTSPSFSCLDVDSFMSTNPTSMEDILMEALGCYTNQLIPAKQVIKSMHDGSRTLQLAAEPQSGKTGVSKCIIFGIVLNIMKMSITLNITSIKIICGCSRTTLKEQWIGEIKEAKQSLKDVLRKNEQWEQSCHVDMITIDVIFRQDLLKQDQKCKNTLYIWDEPDFAITENQTLHKYLTKSGLHSAIQGNPEEIESDNNYVITVGATRCAERSCDRLTETTKLIVAKPGKGYRGIRHHSDNNRIKKCPKKISDKTKTNFKEKINKYKGQKKIIVIRARDQKKSKSGNPANIIMDICNELSFDYATYNMKNKEIVKKINRWELDEDNENPLVIIISGLLTRGDQLDSTFRGPFKGKLCAWFDSGGKNNTLIQRIARIFGYHTYDIDIYVPDGNDNDAIENYLDVIESGFTLNVYNTIHVAKQRKSVSRVETYSGHTKIFLSLIHI